MSTTFGLLKLYELHDFWDMLPENHRKNIVEKFKEKSGFWDYKSLFIGEQSHDITRGAITILDTLLNNEDLELCDILFNKYTDYNSENYLKKSWGIGWVNELRRIENNFEILKEEREGEELVNLNNRYSLYFSLNSSEVFWKDSHMFLSNYASKVYKNYLKSNCTIDRFYNAFSIEYNNYSHIIHAINKMFGDRAAFVVGEQYLIYLEKSKRYDECISLANSFIEQGWRNDFEKRIDRCTKKLNKQSSKS